MWCRRVCILCVSLSSAFSYIWRTSYSYKVENLKLNKRGWAGRSGVLVRGGWKIFWKKLTGGNAYLGPESKYLRVILLGNALVNWQEQYFTRQHVLETWEASFSQSLNDFWKLLIRVLLRFCNICIFDYASSTPFNMIFFLILGQMLR